MMRIRRCAALIGVSAIVGAAVVFTAVPAQADTGDVLITEENSSGTVLGVVDEVVLPGTACDTVTVPDDATELVIDNLTVNAIAVYAAGDCTGTALGTIDALGSGTVPDPAGDIQRHTVVPLKAGGHQVGLALELEQ